MTKAIVIFMQKINGTYHRIGSKVLRGGKKDVRYKGHAYVIDINKPVYRRRNRIFYMMDIDTINPGQIEIGTATCPVSADLVDCILEQELPRQFSNALTKGKGIDGSIILIIVIGAICAAMGFFAGQVFTI